MYIKKLLIKAQRNFYKKTKISRKKSQFYIKFLKPNKGKKYNTGKA